MLPACQQAFIVVKITFQCITKEEKNLNTTIIIVSENKTKKNLRPEPENSHRTRTTESYICSAERAKN